MRKAGRIAAATIGICLALVTPAWCQSPIDAQSDPIRWLSTYLGGAACVVYEAGPPFRLEPVTENTEVQFNGCEMVLQQAGVAGPYGELRTFRIPLGSLEPTAATARAGFFVPEGWTTRGDVPTHTITITTPAGRPLIDERVDQLDGTAPRDSRTEIVTILVRHEENASQIVRALRSAIEMCHQGETHSIPTVP